MSVGVVVDAAVSTVRVDNPQVNALDDSTLEALAEDARELARDASVRAVILTGGGDIAFLAGADLRSLLHDLSRPEMEVHVALTRSVFDAWRDLAMPMIAVGAPNAVGSGHEFATICDLIVADPRAHFGAPEVTLGLIPGSGGTQRLPASAEGAARREPAELAARIAALPALALQAANRAARFGFDADLDAHLDTERELFLKVADSHDARRTGL